MAINGGQQLLCAWQPKWHMPNLDTWKEEHRVGNMGWGHVVDDDERVRHRITAMCGPDAAQVQIWCKGLTSKFFM